MLQAAGEGDGRAVHRTRVATRRLREVLPVLGLEAEVSDKLSRRLRKITKRLGSVRELDVLGGTVEALRASGRHPDAALARIAAGVTAERSRERARHLTRSQMRELHRAAAKLDKLARTLEADHKDTLRGPRSGRTTPSSGRQSCRWAVGARIGHRASLLARAIADAGAVYLPERIHAVRIATKKLRYALELDAELSNVRTTPDLRQLRRAQDLLGHLHDLQVLVDRTREEQASLEPPDLNHWRELDRLVRSVEDECRRLHGRYVHDSASLLALCSRLSGRAEEVGSKARLRG